MIEIADLKATTRFLAGLHAQQGGGQVALVTGEPYAGDIDPLPPMEVVGRGLSPSQIRTMLYNASDEDKAGDDVVIWTVYDEDDNTSYVGLGRMKEIE